MNREESLTLLQALIRTHAPPGDEAETEAVVRREFEATGADVWQDGASNLVAHLPGRGPKVMVAAHKDEIGFIVTDVLADGRLRVDRIGGSYPWKYGEGPVEILTDSGETVRAVLSVGSVHTRSGLMARLRDEIAVKWEHVTLFTGMTPDDLKAAGIHPGSRGVVARERKQIERLGDFIASYALDDRMGLVSMIDTLQTFAAEVERPARQLDLYFVATTHEEVGMLGALRAAQQIQPDVAIALDTSPVLPDDPLTVDARPVIWYREATYHTKSACDRLLKLADQLGFGAQAATYLSAASDSGAIRRAGLADVTVAFGFARDNSHGFEIAHADAMVNVSRLLQAFLDDLVA